VKNGEALAASARWEPTPSTTLALSYIDANADYQLSLANLVLPGTAEVSILVVSAQQRIGTLTLTAELGGPHFRAKIPGLPDQESTGQSMYLQSEWRFSPNWEALLRYDVMYNDTDDRSGKRFEAATGQPAFTQFAKDWTLGLRWEGSPRWMLRAEYHHVYGTAWLPSADNPDPGSDARWNMWLLQGAYRF
jgi:hypothetical protein